MERFIAAAQGEDGAWKAWTSGGPDTELTAICALGLENACSPEGKAARARAEAWLAHAPVPTLDGFLQGLLAFTGDLSWTEIPYVSPRVVDIPYWVRPNLFDIGVVRISLVATAIIQARQDRDPNAWPQNDPTTMPAWKQVWRQAAMRTNRGARWQLNRASRHLDRATLSEGAVARACTWLLARQEKDGTFFASVHMTMIALAALQVVDRDRYAHDIVRGLAAMADWEVAHSPGAEGEGRCKDGETNEGKAHLRQQCFTDATIWDTMLNARLLQALADESEVKPSHAIQHARRFLLSKQIMHVGDYAQRASTRAAGGWGFQRVARHYPDVDDTALALGMLLPMAGNDPEELEGLRSGIRWLLAMQGRNGGWASWDRDDRGWIDRLGGGRWFLRDDPCPVITARAAMILDKIGRGEFPMMADLAQQASRAAAQGFAFVDAAQSDGLWFCRWFTHYLYGTCYGLMSQSHRGGPTACDPRAVAWLHAAARPDGGFGESRDSFHAGRFVPAPSTPFHTGVALMALCASGQAQTETAEHAAQWLLHRQDLNGRWPSNDLYASGLPGVWYVDFSITPTYYGAMGLQAFESALHR